MAAKHGNLSINSDNIFPIIKKWLYSDHDIFFRELISNGCDAITKLKKLDMMGEYALPDGYRAKMEVIVNPEEKTLKFIDNGIGMTADEVEEYINQIAFSGATDFIEKYKDKANEDQIIGHFGLGFYSAFMVADEVEIDTLSWQDGAQAVHWTCDGGTEFDMEDGTRTEVGTQITLHINEDCLEFCNEYKAKEVIKKYCSFMPTDYKEPLFWIHLNMDYPFNMKGILYFPKINMEYESIEGTIKLYNNQVFIADNIKEVIPEFLMLLKGVIDCPDLPLNVSRSALQNDGFVKKISEYITKKVADKLSGMCKTEKEEYEKYWDDISPFIKFGCLKDDKFCEKMTDYILFKNLDGDYMTLPECLEVNKIDPDEAQASETATDENGEKVEAEIVDENGETAEAEAADGSGEQSEAEKVDGEVLDENGDPVADEDGEEEKKEKVIYYVTDEKQQSQYINMFKAAKMDAVVLTHNIDQPFVSQLEAKNEGIKFQRIDADLTDTFKAKTSKKAEKEMEEQAEAIAKLMKKAIGKDGVKVKIEKLKNKKISSMITLSEESRRMQDMMKMYSMPGMDMGVFGKEGETLILNANHPLVQYVLEHQDGDNVKMICEQLYDLALLQQAPLEPEAMTKFVARSNEIMMLLAK